MHLENHIVTRRKAIAFIGFAGESAGSDQVGQSED
jgi:hypothetical protein